ncbi:MAG: c-type cytochrome [Proteobacteria bacterium]|nr:c-type cytochrome [Pseudomonadota bacterium]
MTTVPERGRARRWRRRASTLALAAACGIAARAGSDGGTPLPIGPRAYGDRPTVETMAGLGARIFMDASLSASGRQSCASCHDPAHAFAPPNALPVQLGGVDLRHPGVRNAPSLMYLQTTIPFTEHYIDDEDGHGDDAGPTGGLTWDGRVDSPHEQALIPLFAPHEMANRDARALAARVRKAAYADEFRAAFSAPGRNVLDDPEQTVRWLAMALEIYQQTPAVFYPFTSKFDAVLRHQASYTPQEARGLALFDDPNRGNCATCHPSAIRSDGGFPLFTDAGHVDIGVPRNPAIAANRDPRYHDLGLCGPLRTDLAHDDELCGAFKAPSLRNVALRGSYFHNGAMHSLKDVLEFYVDRDLHPERWYARRADGAVQRYDDLPERLRGHVNREVPFEPLPGDQPRLTAAEIDDVIAFLHTLTDGYGPVPAVQPTTSR